MPSITQRFAMLSDKAKSFTVFISTIAAAYLLFIIMTIFIGSRANDGMKPYVDSQQMVNMYMDSLPKPLHLDAKYFTVFQTQQNLLGVRQKHYLDMGLLFFRNYYSVLVLLMVFSCIGGVVLFMIANQGWAQTWPVLKAFFLAVSLIIAFCGLFPTVFQQKENFDANMKQYMAYLKAELNIVDQLSKLDNPLFKIRKDSVDAVTNTPVRWLDSTKYYHAVDSMITVNNGVINTLTNYILNIDANQIKSPADFSAVISGYLQAKKDSTGAIIR